MRRNKPDGFLRHAEIGLIGCANIGGTVQLCQEHARALLRELERLRKIEGQKPVRCPGCRKSLRAGDTVLWCGESERLQARAKARAKKAKAKR